MGSEMCIRDRCRSAREAVAVNVLPLPTAAYTNSIAANVVDFTDASVNAVSYFWTFGDLTSSTQQNPTHTYAALGNYTACLTVTGANGCTDTLCQTVNITSVGVADISIDRQVQMYPNPVQELLKIRFNKSTEGKSWTIQLTDMILSLIHISEPTRPY